MVTAMVLSQLLRLRKCGDIAHLFLRACGGARGAGGGVIRAHFMLDGEDEQQNPSEVLRPSCHCDALVRACSALLHRL